MTQYYNSKRKRNLYNPDSEEPFKISRSKIELFLQCPKCFYIDRRMGTSRPPGYPFSLNSAVDALLKKEFDIYREKESPHPLMKDYDINAVPFQHECFDDWRNWRKGVKFLHKPTNLIIKGVVDDVWVDSKGKLFIVDYKATSKKGEVNLDYDWQDSYKRQVEIYQWLLRKNGFDINNKTYFVYCNGDTDKEVFNSKIEFDIKIIPYIGDDDWVESVIFDIYECLNKENVPEPGEGCDYCDYRSTLSGSDKISVQKALEIGECDTVEFGSGFGEKKIMKTLASFANTKGGNLFLGIESDGSISGLDVKNAEDKELFINKVRDITAERITPPLLPEVDWIKISSKDVLRIYIEEINKPELYFVDGIVYVRHLASTTKARPKEVNNVLKKRNFF